MLFWSPDQTPLLYCYPGGCAPLPPLLILLLLCGNAPCTRCCVQGHPGPLGPLPALLLRSIERSRLPSPSPARPLAFFPADTHLLRRRSRVNLLAEASAAGLARFPLFGQATATEALLEPGDAVFFPAGRRGYECVCGVFGQRWRRGESDLQFCGCFRPGVKRLLCVALAWSPCIRRLGALDGEHGPEHVGHLPLLTAGLGACSTRLHA